MKFLKNSFSKNCLNSIKILPIIFLVSLSASKVLSEIPDEYKITSSLPACAGSGYKKWNSCYGEFKFPRIIYRGEWKNGTFHGKGILKEAWGDIYVGDFKNNLSEGYGKQYGYKNGKKDGGWWGGEIKNDYLNGKGIRVYPNGSKEEGNFKDHELNGKGIFTYTDGTIEEGNFKDGELNGKGIVTFSNGDIKKGNFKNGELNGKGIITFAIGTKSEGNFKDGELNGKGIIAYASGDIEKGNFKNDQLNGKGTKILSNEDRYTGQFTDGLRNGYGKYTYRNKVIYEGESLDDSFHGKGSMTWPNSDKYVGQWVKDYMKGQGTYFYESGTVYVGEFNNDNPEGRGTITYFNGDKYTGNFLNGNEEGQGMMLYKNGDKYTGQWKKGLSHGKGKMVYENGTFYKGLWKDGEPLEGKTTLAKFTTTEKYYALILGNNEYQKLEKLDNAVTDASDLAKVLKEKYGFETTLLLDQTADETRDALIKFTQNRKSTDNILIYYAGHGQLNKKQKRGYWLPIDASEQLDSKWISNNNIKDYITSSKAKHILLVVDSCFSGSLMRGGGEKRSIEKLTENTLKRLQKLKTRLVITSGGNEYVADGIGGSKNSVFAEPLIKALNNNNDVIRSGELFLRVRNYVVNNADQTPNQSLIHGTGHDGGEFLFFPNK